MQTSFGFYGMMEAPCWLTRCCHAFFQLPSTPPTTNKNVRFPNDLIQRVEAYLQGKNSTFSAFVIEAVRFALDELDRQEKEQKNE